MFGHASFFAHPVSCHFLAGLIGRWRLTREIADFRAGTEAHLRAIAEFSPESPLDAHQIAPARPDAGGVPFGLVLRERGDLHIAGHPPMPAEQGYLWRSHPQGVAVFFGDGRSFHRFALPQTAAIPDPQDAPNASHWCDPDHYRVRYDFAALALGRWQMVWHVQGPRKSYESRSLFERLAPPKA
ncbi:hypothetical protein AQS8620_01858 [Aquimixticola soesokkakensis]|uniref:DUF6314 domain-containing protein n=1 Tax=Aquimixticola soesokkakensis TaxID=1519096 RepID=A0A1Y5SPQ9_9RHOB|nr:DUF6314 family protein [Aquimixticola soesokkakensis]SLN45503.1 hypothetical protein AQS8620_01858 [Aquimixticola soesokkakensis]